MDLALKLWDGAVEVVDEVSAWLDDLAAGLMFWLLVGLLAAIAAGAWLATQVQLDRLALAASAATRSPGPVENLSDSY